MYWKEHDLTDYLASIILSHLYHYLRITNNTNIKNNGIYYNLNWIDTGCKNS